MFKPKIAEDKFGGTRSLPQLRYRNDSLLQTFGNCLHDDCTSPGVRSPSSTAMRATSLESREEIGTQDFRELTSLLADINPPRRTEIAPPYLKQIFEREISASASTQAALDTTLGRANFAFLRAPWSLNKWDLLPKHNSLDSHQLQNLAKEASAAAFGRDEPRQTPNQAALHLVRFASDVHQSQDRFASDVHQSQDKDWLIGQGTSAAMDQNEAVQPSHTGQEQSALHRSSDRGVLPPAGHGVSGTEQQAFVIQDALADPPALTRLSPSHVRSTSPANSHHSSSARASASQASPLHQSRLNTASPSSQSSSNQPSHLHHGTYSGSHAESAVDPQLSPSQGSLQTPHQRPGAHSNTHTQPALGSPHLCHAPHSNPHAQPALGSQQQPVMPSQTLHRSASQSARHSRGHTGQQNHERTASEGYPQYSQPPPPPPTSQHQRPSMQWHNGRQWHQQSNGTNNMAPQSTPQHFGMNPMGLGMYPNVMPYPVMPSIQSQGNMLMPNGYMGMLAYYPTAPPGNMPVYATENGRRGGPRSYGQSAPFPSALDPQYAQYIQQVAQQHQAFSAGHTFATPHGGWTSNGDSSSFGIARKSHARVNAPVSNGFHRRSSSAVSAVSSATSADRDSRHRVIHDRRGDSATATSSSKGSRGQHLDETASAADAEHMAEASSLLEQLKAKTHSQPLELKDIKGFIYEFCRDQHGSRFIQQKLVEGPPEQLMQLYEEIQPHVIALMQDVFGNYVIQKCFEHGSQDVLEALTGTIAGHVLALTLQMYGCRVIQKALEVLPLEQKRVIAKEIQGHVMRCVKDQNGNHVIQKSIERIKPTTEIASMIEDVKANVGQLSTHPYGCRVVQRVLEHCTIPSVKDHIRDQILQATLPLATDQYGNYVIQHMLEHGPESARTEILANLTGQIVQLSQHKFASNVVEKCLQYGQSESRQAIIEEVLDTPGDMQADAGPLQMMMKDPYANYVVQKMLEVCDDSQRQLLTACITTHLNQLKKLTYGKHIVARVEKLLVAGNAAAGQQEVQDATDRQTEQQQTTQVSMAGSDMLTDTSASKASAPTNDLGGT